MSNTYFQLIKQLRTGKEYSQEHVASVIGVSRPTYVAIETGKQDLGVEEAKRLASLYSIGVDDLLSGRIPDIEKYKQMILLYLRMKLTTKDDMKVPKTKLAKLLYLADFAWFYEHLESMSGMQYRRIQYGPVPDAFFRALDELEESGKIVVERKSDDGKDMYLISEAEANSNAKLTKISKDEEKLLKNIAKKWHEKKTVDIVNFTHNQLPYFLCRENELIPYELITQEDPDKVF